MSTAEAPVRAARIRIGISSCLLGQAVRYDGGHKLNEYIVATLGRHFEFVPFCPEVAIGLGTPRPPLELVRTGDGVRVRGVEDTDIDVTERLASYAERVAAKLAVSGYILKHGSPSCGMAGVNVYRASGAVAAKGSGVYATTLMTRLPELPVEEEGRLMDPALRENFIERVLVYRRWQMLMAHPLVVRDLVDFNARHKLIVLAHDEQAHGALGCLLADRQHALRNLAQRYICALMLVLRKPATRVRHAKVLRHILAYLKRELAADDSRELLELIREYRRGEVPLLVPITLLRHHLRRHPVAFLDAQYYLAPAREDMLLDSPS